MNPTGQLEVHGAQRKVVFKGDCLDLLPLCAAMCCRDWFVVVGRDEQAAQGYETVAICQLTNGTCTQPDLACQHIRLLLKRNEDGSCCYLGDDHRCRIYAARPRVCRDFSCRGGWRLASTLSVVEAPPAPVADAAAQRQAFVAQLQDDMVFIPHPLLRRNAVFISQKKGEVVFIKQAVGPCPPVRTREPLLNPKWNERALLRLMEAFGRKESLGDVFCAYNRGRADPLAQDEFYELVWLLNKHGIILSVRNFLGLLAGPGGL